MKTVVVTWMDRTQETYTCDDWKVDGGVLWLTQRMYSGKPLRVIPLHNVKIWTEDR